MRFWITKSSDQPIREQLVRQVVLAILSDDLPAGQRLPSIRAVARRHKIHSNTVSSAYQDLMRRGWVESRRGSGLYVKPLAPSDGGELDTVLAGMLHQARALGHEPEEVLTRLELMIRPRVYERVVVVEDDTGMREILAAEVSAALACAAVESRGLAESNAALDEVSIAVALPSRVAAVRKVLPRSTPCVALRLNSVRKSLEGQTKPAPETLFAVVSRSVEFRSWAHTMLVAVGLDPVCLLDVDANAPDWQRRLTAGTILVTDVVAAEAAPSDFLVRTFPVVAEASFDELRRLLGL